MLILYLATLPKMFVISHSFLVEFLGLLGIGSCHLQVGIVGLLSSLFKCLLFLALVLLLWLGIGNYIEYIVSLKLYWRK
jgi:hypothetical protein